MSQPDSGMIYDLIIVGAGPAGLSTALVLSKLRPDLRDKILVLEKETFPRHKLCGGGLTYDAERMLEKFGLDINELPNTTSAVIELKFHSISFNYKVSPHSLRTVDRQEFDAWLYQGALAAGARIRTGTTVQQITENTDHVTISTNNGDLQAKYVVIANGSRSTFLERNDQRVKAKVIEIILPISEHPFKDPVFDLSAKSDGYNGYYWAFPSNDQSGKTLNIGLYDANVMPRNKKNRSIEALTNWAAKHNIQFNPSDVKGAPINLLLGKPIVQRGRKYFIGDAVGVDALLGEGISFSLGYGTVAGKFFANALDQVAIPDFRSHFEKTKLYKTIKRRALYAKLFYFFHWDWTTATLWAFFSRPINFLMRYYHAGWSDEIELDL